MKKLLALLLLLPGMAWAACTSPTGAETDILYNGDFHTYQYCDGTNWQAIGGGSTSWYYLNAIPLRVQAVSNGTPFDVTGLTVTGTISGSSLISTSAGGTVSASGINAGIISDTGGLLVAGQSSLANVSATAYQGNGALVTNVTAAAMSWYGLTAVPTVLQNISNSTGSVTATSFSGNIFSATGAGGIVTASSVYGGSVSGSTGTFGSIGSGALTASGLITAQAGLTATGGITATTTLSAPIVSATGAGMYATAVSASGLITAQAGVNVTGAVTATTTMASTGAMTAGGLFTASAGVNVTGAITLTTIFNGATLISTSVAGVVTASAVNAGTVSGTKAFIGNLTEGVVSTTASTSQTALNVANGDAFYVAISSNTTISLTGATVATLGKSVQIFVKQDVTGGRTINYTSPTHHWNNQVSTTQITSGSTISQWSWTTYDGQNWFGGLVGSGM